MKEIIIVIKGYFIHVASRPHTFCLLCGRHVSNINARPHRRKLTFYVNVGLTHRVLKVFVISTFQNYLICICVRACVQFCISIKTNDEHRGPCRKKWKRLDKDEKVEVKRTGEEDFK